MTPRPPATCPSVIHARLLSPTVTQVLPWRPVRVLSLSCAYSCPSLEMYGYPLPSFLCVHGVFLWSAFSYVIRSCFSFGQFAFSSFLQVLWLTTSSFLLCHASHASLFLCFARLSEWFPFSNSPATKPNVISFVFMFCFLSFLFRPCISTTLVHNNTKGRIPRTRRGSSELTERKTNVEV